MSFWRMPTTSTLRALAGAILLAAIHAPSLLAQAPELTLQAGTVAVTGDDRPRSDTEWGLVRLSWGDRIQLRGEVAWLRLDGAGAPTGGGIGPVSPETPHRTRSGNGGGNPAGPGAGPDGSAWRASTQGSEVVTETELEPITVSGWSDLRLSAALRLAGGGTRLHRVELGLAVKLPTADAEEGLSSGETDFRIGLTGEYRFWSLTLFGGAGYNRIGDPPGVELDDVPDAYVGVESVPLRDRVLLSSWIEGHPGIAAEDDDRAALGVGVRTLGTVRFELLGSVGLTDGAEDFSVSLGVAFGLRPPGAGPSGARR